MSSFYHRVFTRSTFVAIILGVAGFLTPSLAAQQQTFRVVPDHSTARLFVGSQENPTFFNVGVTRVSGEVKLDPDDPQASTFNLNIYAANENEATDADAQALAGSQPVISFQSRHVTQRGDGSLQVDGQLTVIQAEQTSTDGTGEDYSGPAYTTTGLSHSVHDASFIFTPLVVQSAPDDSSTERSNVLLLTAQQSQSQAAILVTASTRVNGEDFPELLVAIEGSAWPAVVNDAKCVEPSSVGEDYSGPICTGNVIETFPSPGQPVQTTGEDYAGQRPVAPQGEQVTIHLGLYLAGANNSSRATSGQPRPDAMGNTLLDIIQSLQTPVN